MNFTILRFDSIESTNAEAARQAKAGADEGVCVVARRQTSGRGRHGRIWISEKDAGLYLSVVLRPRIETRFLPLITLMSAVAVYDALVALYRLQPDIKWANDVLINEKKICGILAEMTETKTNSAIVLGIGINLTSANFAPEIAETATSIERETNHKPDCEMLLENLLGQIARRYEILKNDDGARRTREAWARRSSYHDGKNVRVAAAGNETITGTTCGIEPDGALRVLTGDGAIKIVRAGDVERLRAV